MKKLVMRLDLEDDKAKRKAMKIVSTLQGIDSIAVDMQGKKMTVIGTVDPVRLVGKLRKYWQADIITIGPAKEPEKKKEEAKPTAAEEGKKGEGKEEGKKEEGKGEGDEKKKEEGKKEDGGGKKMEVGEKKKNEEEEPDWESESESESEWSSEEEEVVRKKPIPEHLLGLIRGRQYNPYMGNYPPYMAMGMGMANPYMSNPQPHPQHQPQPSYFVQRVVEEENDNTNGCSIF